MRVDLGFNWLETSIVADQDFLSELSKATKQVVSDEELEFLGQVGASKCFGCYASKPTDRKWGLIYLFVVSEDRIQVKSQTCFGVEDSLRESIGWSDDEKKNQSVVDYAFQNLIAVKTKKGFFESLGLRTQDKQSFSLDNADIVNYTEWLEKRVLSFDGSEERFLKMVKPSSECDFLLNGNSGWKHQTKWLELACMEMGYKEDSPFVYNDLDNRVWMNEGRLWLEDQNSYLVKSKTEKGWDVYLFDKNFFEVKEITDMFEKKTLSKAKHLGVSLEDNKLVYVNQIAAYCFDFMSFAIDAIKEEKKTLNFGKKKP